MRKIIFLAIFFLFTTSIFGDDISNLRMLLDEIYSIIKNTNNEYLIKAYNEPINQFNKNNLILKIDKNTSNSILGRASFSFNVNDDAKQYINIEEKVLRFYPENKSLIMAILMHEFKHASDYYKNKDYFKQIQESKVEQYLYEMDALYIESLFINECLKLDYKLSNFEKFFMNSNIEDNLQIVSVILTNTDKEMIYYFYAERLKCYNEEITKSEYLNLLLKYSDQILMNYKGNINTDDWDSFYFATQLQTYINFVPEFADSILTKDGLKTCSDVISKLNKKLDEFRSMIESEMDNYKIYNDKIIKILLEDTV